MNVSLEGDAHWQSGVALRLPRALQNAKRSILANPIPYPMSIGRFLRGNAPKRRSARRRPSDSRMLDTHHPHLTLASNKHLDENIGIRGHDRPGRF